MSAVLTVGGVLLLTATGCASPVANPVVPQPHWLSGARECTVDRVMGEADHLVRDGLRDAGYRHLIVGACASAPQNQRDAVAAALSERGLTLVTARPDRAAVFWIGDAFDLPRLRTDLTAALMDARPWVLGSGPFALPSEVRAVVANPEVLELAGDSRAARGGTVSEDTDVLIRSRSVGVKGLIVALTNRQRWGSSTIGVPTAVLGLSGSIRAIDAWSGREFVSHDGWLGGEVGAGDTLLLEIV